MAGTTARARRPRCESGGGVSLLTRVPASWLWVLLQTDYPGPTGPLGGTDVAAGPHQPSLLCPLTQPGTPRVRMASQSEASLPPQSLSVHMSHPCEGSRSGLESRATPSQLSLTPVAKRLCQRLALAQPEDAQVRGCPFRLLPPPTTIVRVSFGGLRDPCPGQNQPASTRKGEAGLSLALASWQAPPWVGSSDCQGAPSPWGLQAASPVGAVALQPCGAEPGIPSYLLKRLEPCSVLAPLLTHSPTPVQGRVAQSWMDAPVGSPGLPGVCAGV